MTRKINQARIIKDGDRIGVALENQTIVDVSILADHVIWLDGLFEPAKAAQKLRAAWNLYSEIVDGSPSASVADLNVYAWKKGLGHWRCVSPNSNALWRRNDGAEWEFTARMIGGWVNGLRAYDREHPMDEEP